MSPKRYSPGFLFLFQLASALAGIALSLYLLVQHTELKSGIQAEASFCSISSYVDCDVVNSSDFSEVLGIPTAALGALFYFTVLILALLFPLNQRGFAWGQGWIARLSLLGLAIDCYLLIVQTVVLRNFCVMCLLTYVATLGVFITAYLGSERRTEGFKRFVRAVVGPGFAPPPQLPAAHALFTLITLASFVTVLWLVPAAIRMRSQSYQMVNKALDQFFEAWKELPIRKFAVKPGDGVYGNPNAKVQIVEFSDFECPFCQKAAFTLHTAKQTLKDRVQFVFKHFPLDSACNSSVRMQMHPNACALARLSFCQNQKGKFWDFHDAVFFKWDAEKKKGTSALAQAVADGPLKALMTEDEYRQCLNDPASLANAQEDIRLGQARNVDATPTVFINGKQVTIPLSLENLRRLVEIEEKL